MRSRFLVLVSAVLLVGAFSPCVWAAGGYPAKPIELVCPFPAGASMDVMARLIADIAPKYTGQPMVVTTKTGASGSLAAADVISAKADGYKLVTLANLFFSSTVHIQKVPFNPDDLVPIGNFMEYRIGMAVRSDSPWKTFNDLLDYAKKNPGQLKWGHSGRGTSLHVAPLYVFKKTGAQTVEVPYKGSTEVLTALLGGHVNAGSVPYGTAKENVRAGQIRYLTFYSEQRYKDQQNVPSIAELGFPDAAKLSTYVAVFAHKNTPEPIKKYLVTLAKQIYDDPKFRKLEEMGGEDQKYGGPEFVRDSIKRAETVGIPILKELGLYIGK